jgi:hypothetical protein
MLGYGGDGFVDAADGDSDRAKASLIEDLGKHGGDELVEAVADGDD